MLPVILWSLEIPQSMMWPVSVQQIFEFEIPIEPVHVDIPEGRGDSEMYMHAYGSSLGLQWMIDQWYNYTAREVCSFYRITSNYSWVIWA